MEKIINKIRWYFNRLKTMGVKEISWRISQEILMQKEYFSFYKKKRIDEISYRRNAKSLEFNIDKLELQFDIKEVDIDYKQEFYAEYCISEYNFKWHTGFNTCNSWPLKFSYKLDYKGADIIGDARINWQLNRHYEFVLIAKKYYLTKDSQYYNELVELYNDWNEQNPFLYGISWTSPMEIAIRCSNWVYTYYFVYSTNRELELLNHLKLGIVNMSDYVWSHQSKYSSANNHLIVEMYCVLLTAFLCDDNYKINSCYEILKRELVRQNYEDGVNKEQSLHYQAFFLEAFALSSLILKKAGKNIEIFKKMISKMCEFVYNCMDENGEMIEFGDNDEGYILRFGDEDNYYKYVLNLCSEAFDIPFSTKYQSETLKILFNKKFYEEFNKKRDIVIFPYGGYAIVRDMKKHLLFGIDFGELGFGKIAAHGHADALSFQVILNGEKFLIDPGTYIYHIDRVKRDYYRKTINHNTVCINEQDQSEIKGSFLWGKKACSKLLHSSVKNNEFCIELSHNGYGFDVKRTYQYDWNNNITVIDEIGDHVGVANFTFAKGWEIEVNKDKVYVYANGKKCIFKFYSANSRINKVTKLCSLKYGVEEETNALEISFKTRLETKISIGE